MRILFDHPQPFFLAHGGFQTQIEQTRRALEELGIDVEWARWWDSRQAGDVLHYFGATRPWIFEQARTKNLRTVMTSLLSETCNRSDARLWRQGKLVNAVLSLPFGEGIKQQLNWRSYASCDCNVVGLEAERQVLKRVYRVPPNRIEVVPLGLSPRFLSAGKGDRSEPYLVCVGTICEQKNCIPLAELARRAEAPVLFVGKPYTEDDPYWAKFKSMIDGRWVCHQPHVDSEEAMIALLQKARGAVIMSKFENWCLAAHEAAACGLPLLLPPLKWARERFGDHARYFVGGEGDVEALRKFYGDCAGLPAPAVTLFGWNDTATKLCTVYERVLSTSR